MAAAVPARPVPQPRAPRVTLASVVRQVNAQPLRILLHGLEGVGKTTFAAGAPAPIFICPEDGLPRDLGEVAHFPGPAGGWAWSDVIDAIRALAAGGHEYQTLVLDTIDWLEPLLWAELCAKNGWANIEDPGYGKGYTAAVDGWRSLIAELEQLRRARGMGIIALAHTWIRPFKNPEGEDYDRYELKINNKASGLWKEWSDAVLFARHDDQAAKDPKTKRVRGVSAGGRFIHTVHHAAYDAKNRFSLPERLPLDYQEFAAAVAGGEPAPAAELLLAIEEGAKQLPEGVAEKVRAAVAGANGHAATLAQILNRVNARLAEQGEQQQKGAA